VVNPLLPERLKKTFSVPEKKSVFISKNLITKQIKIILVSMPEKYFPALPLQIYNFAPKVTCKAVAYREKILLTDYFFQIIEKTNLAKYNY